MIYARDIILIVTAASGTLVTIFLRDRTYSFKKLVNVSICD